MFERLDVVQGLEEVHEIKTSSGKLVLIQIAGEVLNVRCEANLARQLLGAVDRAGTDVDTSKAPYRNEGTIFW